MLNTVTVYCGTNAGSDARFLTAATDLGRSIAESGSTVVYGGGGVGMMGALADGALAAGGRVVGVMPHHLHAFGMTHERLSELHLVDHMHQRKAVMAERADAFVALPGGFGTLDELVEVLTWARMGLHGKPCGALNIAGFFDPLTAYLRHMAAAGFASTDEVDLLLVDDDPVRILHRLAITAAAESTGGAAETELHAAGRPPVKLSA